MLKETEEQCERLILNNIPNSSKKYQEALKDYDDMRRIAAKAREDLIIHRQAIGFTYRNQAIVEEEFPLPPPR